MFRLFVLLMTLLGLMLVSVDAQDALPLVEETDCPYFMDISADEKDLSIWCGYLHVPENRDDAVNGPELDLFFVYVESLYDTDNAPLVYLDGGPGGAASLAFPLWVADDIDMLETYDVIFIDQRGTGLSSPSLNCYEFDEMDDEDDAIVACRERLLAEGIDLDMYNSATNAHDIHDLLLALDIPQANLYGISYGSRLALTVMRDFPDRIRASIIDGIYPPNVDSLVEQATYGNQAFEQLFVDCEADPRCNKAYPKLRDTFYALVRVLNDNPADMIDYEYDATYEMTGGDFINEIFNRLYDASEIPYLPALIADYAAGNYDSDPYYYNALIPDEIDVYLMDTYGFATVDDLYDHYNQISDDAFDDLMFEADEALYYVLFMDYLELETIDETLDYLDTLSDEAYSELEAWVTGYYDDDSEGMYYSVECAEEIPFYTIDDALAYSEPLPEIIADALNDDVSYGFWECDVWDVQQANEIETQAVVSDIPTLIYSGAYDPITPYQWGDVVAEHLSTSWHYVFPAGGHGAVGDSSCAMTIALAFLAEPDSEPNNGCFMDLEAPNFFIR